PDPSTQSAEGLIEKARAIREEITSGKRSFADAARAHSAGASAPGGGDLGFISRHGAMAEAFSKAAFALEEGQVSQPVVTRFGVHLIRSDRIKPGARKLADAREEVHEALARELLREIAQKERRHTPVAFTGRGPYFRPGTRELVVPH
ncbi:MAG: peptidylprolyl isomerase, partial [Planctomycetota bacterium]